MVPQICDALECSPREKVFAGERELRRSSLLLRILPAIIGIQNREMIRLIFGEELFGEICFVAFVERRHKRRTTAQDGSNREHGIQAPKHGAVEEHLTHANIHG